MRPDALDQFLMQAAADERKREPASLGQVAAVTLLPAAAFLSGRRSARRLGAGRFPGAAQLAELARLRAADAGLEDAAARSLAAITASYRRIQSHYRDGGASMSMQTSASAAYPARQAFGRASVVHAVASHRIDLPRLTLGQGEPLCGTFAEMQRCPAGLFTEPVTCTRCLAVIDAAQLTIGDDQ